jgi:DNA-binding NarL/FixJ family response regulator
MSRCTVVVIHREPLVAEALGSALDRTGSLTTIRVGTDPRDAILVPADAAVIDGTIRDAAAIAERLRSRGRRAVVLDGRLTASRGSFPTDRSIVELAHELAPHTPRGADAPALTAREREVLSLVASGLAGKQVARALGISTKTVEQHKTRIYGKLGVANQAAAVAAVAGGADGARWISSTT